MATSEPVAQTAESVIQRRERRSRPGLAHTSAKTKSREASVNGLFGVCVIGKARTSPNILAPSSARSLLSVMASLDGGLAAHPGAQRVDGGKPLIRLVVPVSPAV